MNTLDRGVLTNLRYTFHHTRLEAIQMLERSLAEGDFRSFELFLERQLLRQPPPIDLLQHLVDDLQARLNLHCVEASTSHATKRECAVLFQAHAYVSDWLRGISAQVSQHAAAQHAAILPIREPIERQH